MPYNSTKSASHSLSHPPFLVSFTDVKTHQLIKHTPIQLPLIPPALPQLLIVRIQTLPMLAELLQTLPIHVVQHARRAARHLAPFLEALGLAFAVGERLAVHVVVIVGFAAGPDEEGGAEEGSGGGADFVDFGDGVRERGGVDEDLLVESGGNMLGRGGALGGLVREEYLGCRADMIAVLLAAQWVGGGREGQTAEVLR